MRIAERFDIDVIGGVTYPDNLEIKTRGERNMMIEKVSFVSGSGHTHSLCPGKWEICHIEHATPGPIFCGMYKKLAVDGFLIILPSWMECRTPTDTTQIIIEYDSGPTDSYVVKRPEDNLGQTYYKTPKHGNILLKSVTDGYQPREFTDEEIDEICGCYE